jgi:hypothetical protein
MPNIETISNTHGRSDEGERSKCRGYFVLPLYVFRGVMRLILCSCVVALSPFVPSSINLHVSDDGHLKSTPSTMKVAGLAGATLTVVVTTLDDAVWLVPYLASPSLSLRAKALHAFLFVATLVSLAAACVMLAEVIQRTAFSYANPEETEIILGAIGAGICWIIALVLFIRKMLKRRRRAEQARLVAEDPEVPPSSTPNETTYGSTHPHEEELNDEDWQELPSSMSPWTVISLTALGALDELSYFPALILGGIFSPTELCLGTFLASILILVIVTCFLARLQPVVDCFDRIPLYAIVAAFATLLTIETIFDGFELAN